MEQINPIDAKLGAPGFPFFQATEFLSKGTYVFRFSRNNWKLDIVFGEIDR